MTDYGVTSAGFVKKSFDEIQAEEFARAKQYFGPDVDLSPESPLYQFLMVQIYEKADLWAMGENVYNSAYLDTATGQSLDNVVYLNGITRKAAVAATGTVTFSRETATAEAITIPEGTRVSNQDGTVIFATTVEGVIPANGTSVNIAAACTVGGISGNVAAAAIQYMVDTVPGVDAVTNAAAFADGADKEADSLLRARTVSYAPEARGTMTAIKNALTAISGVIAVIVSENTTAHTISAIVYGGTDADITAALEEYRPCGILASFSRPVTISIAITVTVSKKTGYTVAAVSATVAAAITAYFTALTLSTDIYYSEAAAAILQAEGVAGITSLSITGNAKTISAFGESITIGDAELPLSGAHSITVT